MEHNIMLYSNSGSRFPLLPLSSRTNAMNVPNETEYNSIPQVSQPLYINILMK